MPTPQPETYNDLVHVNFSLQAAVGKLRNEKFMDREYVVVPAVLVRAQILRNNLGITLLPPEDITEQWADDWNAAPVILHDHPTQRGMPISARQPSVMDSRCVGYVFRAEAVKCDGTMQLKAEVWLDQERAGTLTELETILNRLRHGEPVELSTGFPTVVEERVGVFNGDTFERILHPRGVDHLAIFVDQAGACSVEHGCGLGVNRKDFNVTTSADQERGLMVRTLARLSGVLKDENGGTLKPCPNASNAETTTGPEVRAILRRLKAMGMTNAEIGEKVGRSASAIQQAERGQILNPDSEVLAKLQALMPATNEERSDEERRMMLGDALDGTFGGSNKMVWIEAVFSETKRVVFGVVAENNVGDRTEELFEVTFTAAENVQDITFSDPTAVARRVVYEPVGNTETNEEGTMTEQEKKAAEDKAAEEQAAADKVTAENKAAEDKAAADKAAEDKAAADQAAADKATAENKTPCPEGEAKELEDLRKTVADQATALQKANDAITELQTVTAPVVDEQERERTALVAELVANESVPFAEEQLKAKPVEELRMLRAMSRGAHYAGRGGPQVAQNEAEAQFMAPVRYWEKDEPAQNKGDK